MDALTTLTEEIKRERGYIGSDYVGIADMLRHVAFCNFATTRKDFVAAAVAAGINPNTARIQFSNSRKSYSEIEDGGILLPDGRIIYPD